MITVYDTQKAEEYFTNKNAFTTGPVEVSRKIENGDHFAIIDVRDEEDFKKGHVPGAVNLPEDQWRTFRGLLRDAPNVLYCYTQTCHLAAKAAQLFSHEGYSVMEMEGGFETWKQNKLEVER